MKDPHAQRVVEALHKVSDLLNVEFSDLTPPERCFVVSQVQWAYHASFDDVVQPRKGD